MVKAAQSEAPKGALGPGSYEAKHIILATGARPRVLPGLEPDQKLVWTYFEAMIPERMPKSLLVVGSGAIGIEFASFYRSFGCEVTVVEVLPQILPAEDAEIAGLARKALEKQGIKIFTGAKVVRLDKKADSVTATIDDGKGATSSLTVERVISAVGVIGNTENLGLEKLGVKIERGTVIIDGYCRTNVPGIYAIGDVIAGAMLAHKAEDEGVAVAEIIAGKAGHVNYDVIPNVIYTFPEVASVGKSEEELKAAGIAYASGRFPFTANGRAKVNHQTDGFVKILADAKTDRVLGVHIIGADAGNMIAEAAVAMEFGGAAEDIARTCHAHPTLSEAIKEAALAVDKRAISM
jgi:dihydrolipoamide dehydrogenase